MTDVPDNPFVRSPSGLPRLCGVFVAAVARTLSNPLDARFACNFKKSVISGAFHKNVGWPGRRSENLPLSVSPSLKMR